MLLADRFLRRDDGWFDIATAERVAVVVHQAGSRRTQIEWAERCAMLAMLRHPLLRPLVDYGAASATTLFEAYAMHPPLEAPAPVLSHVVRHGTRFLEAHGIALSAALAATLLRPLVPSSDAPRGPAVVGVTLQPRAAWSVVAEWLSARLPRGPKPIRLVAAPRMGMRTCRAVIARMARFEGYVPVCPDALWQWRDLADEVAGRHLCLLISSDTGAAPRAAAAALLARTAVRCRPAPVCLTTERSHVLPPGAIHLDPMGMTTMASMIYFDPDYGPAEQEVFDAARWSEGAPGRFLDRLQGIAFDRPAPRALVVHESPAAYGERADLSGGEAVALAGAPAADERRSRIGSVLRRASSRASALEARGRHAAAGRLLARAARVLRTRGETALAARCWLQLAWMARTRGALDRAHDCAAQAAAADTGAESQIRAGCVRAVCWTDAERFEEAGSALRDLVVAATTAGNASLVHASQLALARVRLWAGRPDEAAAIVEPLVIAADPETACAALALKAKARLASADLAGALQAARAAIGRLPAAADGRIVAATHRVMAEALCEAGDLTQVRLHVRTGLEAAAAARLPLQALRLRAVLVRGLRACDGGGADRVALGVMRVRRRGVPPLVERFLLRQLDGERPADQGCGGREGSASRQIRAARTPRPAPFEDFLDLSHRAGSDHEAIAGVLSAVCARLDAAAAVVVASDGRICGAAGKPWGGRSRAQEAALLSGQPVCVDGSRQPPEAAEPIRCAGALLGVLACRWIAGATAEPVEVSESLHAAGLSVAAHLRALLEQVPAPPASVWGDLLGDSAQAASLRDDIHRAARAPFPVLIEGESGSGKELVARAVHRLSPRHARRFCAINCAALSDELLEAELFGHTRGAFTGALTERAGLFEEADGGTLFLDEVGELSGRAQAKLLRVLQEGEVRRVGENLPRRVDVRIVAATNRRLEGEAASGRFRADLRFRLDVLRIAVPPLRERVDDIAMLAQHFWKQAVARVGSQATLGSEALAALSRYDWPGNVRELQNAIAWMAVHAPRRGRVGAAVLPSQLATAPLATGSSFELAREEFERRYVRAALAQAGGHRVGAAKALGISRQGLAKMMRRLRIEER